MDRDDVRPWGAEVRRAAKVDDNQAQLVAALRVAGCSVQSLAALGAGVPDLLVGRAGRNYLLEVKDGSLSPSRRVLTEDQQVWHRNWRGAVYVVESVQEAFEAVGLVKSCSHSIGTDDRCGRCQ